MATMRLRKKNPLSLEEVRFAIHLAQMDLTDKSKQNKTKKIRHEIGVPNDVEIKLIN